MEKAPRARLREHQRDRLRALLAQVLDSNPFYRQKFIGSGFRSPGEFNSTLTGFSVIVALTQ